MTKYFCIRQGSKDSPTPKMRKDILHYNADLNLRKKARHSFCFQQHAKEMQELNDPLLIVEGSKKTGISNSFLKNLPMKRNSIEQRRKLILNQPPVLTTTNTSAIATTNDPNIVYENPTAPTFISIRAFALGEKPLRVLKSPNVSHRHPIIHEKAKKNTKQSEIIDPQKMLTDLEFIIKQPILNAATPQRRTSKKKLENICSQRNTVMSKRKETPTVVKATRKMNESHVRFKVNVKRKRGQLVLSQIVMNHTSP